MKDIKSILIGVFATTCLFLFIGATNNSGEGKWEIATSLDNNGVHLLNKETGVYYKPSYSPKTKIWTYWRIDMVSDNPSKTIVMRNDAKQLTDEYLLKSAEIND